MVHREYLKELADRVTSVLKEKLNSLYVIGSASLDDYIERRSDLDVLGITNSSLTISEKDQLEEVLGIESFPCPARGLDMVLLTRQSVEHMEPKPAYEFWFSTGRNWPKEKWETGQSSEMLIFMELCRKNGYKIYQKGPSVQFDHIGRDLILIAFQQILEWHKNYILDDYHDPGGQNSVLNACRIFNYIESNRFYSKTDGGKSALRNNPGNLTIQKALNIRQNADSQKITKEEILKFITSVEKQLQTALNQENIGEEKED